MEKEKEAIKLYVWLCDRGQWRACLLLSANRSREDTGETENFIPAHFRSLLSQASQIPTTLTKINAKNHLKNR